MASPTSSTCTHCQDFSRSQLLRAGFARAGAGLPAIETGMPDPAGTGLSRRSFLARSAGVAMTVFGASALAPARLDAGLEAAMAAAGDDRVLVSVYLAGGLDGLTALAPVGDPRYKTLRPNLAVPVSGDPLNVFAPDDRLQWYPSMRGLRDLYTEGKVAVLPAIGYTNANGSHFTSRHYWEVGETDARNHLGWMGRYLDANGAPDNPLQGLTVGYSLQPSLAPASAPVSTIADPTSYGFWSENGGPGMADEAVLSLSRLGVPRSADDAEVGSARAALRQLGALKASLGPLQQLPYPFQSSVSYPPNPPTPFPARMAMIAEMIHRGLPLRCVALQSAHGYDTHAGHKSAMNNSLKLDIDTITAFQRDLEARGVADRVLIHVWSEFGRRVLENGPDGCDHGAAGISFLIGTNVQGQMIGEFPGLSVLDSMDNLRPTTDYRALYCSMIEQWLGADAEPIIPGAASLARYQLLKT
jgi:uncharacterized protein (DUF1501 family)